MSDSGLEAPSGRPGGCAPSPDGADFLERLRGVARGCGYAIGVHGSLKRDLDLVAVPWMVEATDARTLVDAICEQLGLYERAANTYPDSPIMPNPEPKPWGRLGWSLDGCPKPWAYVDLSVAPRAGEPIPVISAFVPKPAGTGPEASSTKPDGAPRSPLGAIDQEEKTDA